MCRVLIRIAFQCCFLRYRCRLPTELRNASYVLSSAVLNASYPWDPKKMEFSSCSRKEGEFVLHCDDFIYDYSKYESSAVIEVKRQVLKKFDYENMVVSVGYGL